MGERGGVEYASFMRPLHFEGLGKVVNRKVLTTFEFATVGTVVGTVVVVVVVVGGTVDVAVVDYIVCSFVDLEDLQARVRNPSD